MFKLILILFACNKAKADFCPILNVTYKNFQNYSYHNSREVYQYKEVDSTVVSPFYGIGDKDSNVILFGHHVKIVCHYIDKEDLSEENKMLYVNQFQFEQMPNENKLLLKYSNGITDWEFFCGSGVQMNEVWLIDYLEKCFISFYGCKIAEINGASKKFEGVLILKDINRNKSICSNDNLRYTYDVLQKQAELSISSLKKVYRKDCFIEKAQKKICETNEKDNLDDFARKRISIIFCAFLFVVLVVLVVNHLIDKYV